MGVVASAADSGGAVGVAAAEARSQVRAPGLRLELQAVVRAAAGGDEAMRAASAASAVLCCEWLVAVAVLVWSWLWAAKGVVGWAVAGAKAAAPPPALAPAPKLVKMQVVLVVELARARPHQLVRSNSSAPAAQAKAGPARGSRTAKSRLHASPAQSPQLRAAAPRRPRRRRTPSEAIFLRRWWPAAAARDPRRAPRQAARARTAACPRSRRLAQRRPAYAFGENVPAVPALHSVAVAKAPGEPRIGRLEGSECENGCPLWRRRASLKLDPAARPYACARRRRPAVKKKQPWQARLPDACSSKLLPASDRGRAESRLDCYVNPWRNRAALIDAEGPRVSTRGFFSAL